MSHKGLIGKLGGRLGSLDRHAPGNVLPQGCAASLEATDRCVDQPAGDPLDDKGGDSLISEGRCLKVVDRFRGLQEGPRLFVELFGGGCSLLHTPIVPGGYDSFGESSRGIRMAFALLSYSRGILLGSVQPSVEGGPGCSAHKESPGSCFAMAEQDEGGENLSNLKLQKLLYYAQGAHLALHGSPLFEEKIKAWQHGPVVPQVWHDYKGYGAAEIEEGVTDDFSDFPEEAIDVLEDVYDVFGQFSAWKLRNMTHNEPPWQEAWGKGSGTEISHDSMRDFFKDYVTA